MKIRFHKNDTRLEISILGLADFEIMKFSACIHEEDTQWRIKPEYAQVMIRHSVQVDSFSPGEETKQELSKWLISVLTLCDHDEKLNLEDVTFPEEWSFTMQPLCGCTDYTIEVDQRKWDGLRLAFVNQFGTSMQMAFMREYEKMAKAA